MADPRDPLSAPHTEGRTAAHPASGDVAAALPIRLRLRQLLDDLHPSDSDLEAFCGDHFPEVRKARFTLGMDRVQKLTLLLDHVPAGKLIEALRQQYLGDDASGREDLHAVKLIQALLQEYPQPAGALEQAEVAARARLVHVPELPPHFLDRDVDMASLKKLVLGPPHTAVAVTGRALRTGVQGMGGIGKTVLAARLAYDEEIRCAFPDGIFWITLGQSPLMTQRQAELCAALGDSGRAFQDEQQGQARLTELMANRACLVILDDAWQLDQVTAFGKPGSGGRILFTTRDASIVTSLAASAHCVDKLTDEQAMRLLADWSGQPPAGLPAEAQAVAKECGHLPLALAMIGASVHGAPDGWTDALDKLRAADLAAIAQKLPDYPYPDLLRAIQVSIDALPANARARYLDLAVFPEDTPIPKAVLQTFWKALGLKEYQTRDVLNLLGSRSLLRRDEQGHFLLHDLQRDYVIQHVGDLPGLHGRLLDAYAACCPRGWASGPDDGYFFLHVAYHLSAAGRLDELRRMLADFAWLQAKLRATDAASVVTDFTWLRSDDALDRIAGAIQLAAHILAQDKAQLASQLVGRLCDESHAEIQDLIAGIVTEQGEPWLRPLMGNLTRPGGPLLRTLVGHSDAVTAVAVTSDGRCAVSCSDDRMIKVWDLRSGGEIRSFTAHSRNVNALAVTPDGRWAVTGSNDCTLKVWDLQTGHEKCTLWGHWREVWAVAVTADGRWAVSAASDLTLRVWDLQTAREERMVSGHLGLSTVAVTANGRWVVSGARDATINVWELHTGQVVCTLAGHTGWVESVAISVDNRWMVSGSFDCTLKVWDLQTGQEVRTLPGHSASVTAVAVTADGCWAVSGSDDRTLKVWDVQTGREARTLSGHLGRVSAVAVTSDGRWAISGSQDRTLKVWDLHSTVKLRSNSTHARPINAMAVTADGRWAVSGSDDWTLKLWDVQTGQELLSFAGHSARVSAVAITKDGRWAISGSLDHTLKVWELHSGRMVRTFSGHEGWVRAVAVTADGRWVVSGAGDTTLKVWDLESGSERLSFCGHSDRVSAVAVTADGRCAISGSYDRSLKVWDLQTGQEVRSLVGHLGWATAVAVTADNCWAISGSCDHTLKVWDLLTGQHVRSLRGHSDEVTAVGVTADGRFVVSTALDHTLRVWDLHAGSVLATFTADCPVYAVAVAADSRSIVAGDSQGMVHFLRLEGV